MTTIRELVERHQLSLSQTVYAGERGTVLDYRLETGDFFQCLQGGEHGANDFPVYEFYQACRWEEERLGMAGLLETERQNLAQAAGVKANCHGLEKKALLAELKGQRRVVRGQIGCLRKEARELTSRRYGENRDERYYFRYKNHAMLTSFDNIARMVPELGAAALTELREFPWLSTNLARLHEAVCGGGGLGVVGGPCLYSVGEVLLLVETQDGGQAYFDCSHGQHLAAAKSTEGLHGYLGRHRHQIKKIRVVDRKQGLTKQEYVNLLYVFEIASLLQGNVVVPLPDFTYINHMAGAVSPLETPLREALLAEFEAVAYHITDLFLAAIGRLKSRYQSLPVLVLHGREKGLLQAFYRQREPFIRSSGQMRRLAGMDGKKDAVVDYITMLALPYYLYGDRQIVQVDSLAETDSGRKCQKIHGDAIVLHSLLYPEIMSRDGKQMTHYAAVEDKEYLS